MANEFVAKNGLISQNNTTISGSLTVSASSGIPLQIKGGTGTLLSVSSSTSEIFKISDTFSPNLFTVSTGSIDIFNIDNTNKVTISGSLIITQGITGSFSGSFSGSLSGVAATASSVVGATPTEIGYLSGVTSNIQTQLDNTADISIEAYQKLGSKVKAQTLGFNISNLTLNTVQMQGATAGSQIRLIPIYIQTPQTLTGVMWFQNALGVYTPNNENRIGLYTYSGGTATLVASSSNDGNMWSGSYTTAATYTSKSFSTPYNANPDFYYIAMLMSFSAVSTAPTFFAGPNLVSTAVSARSLDFTNGAIITAARTTVAALPGSITVSTYNTVIQGNIWAAVYS